MATTHVDHPQILTEAEVLKILRTSRASLFRWRAAGLP